MINSKTIFKIAILIGILVVYYSCTPAQHEDGNHSIMEHTSVSQRVKKYNDSITYTVTTANALEQVKTVLAEIHDTVSFLIPERTMQIKSFPCTNCHSKPIDQLALGRKENEKKAHWDIKIIHGNTDVMNCSTCHTDSNLNELTSLTGTPIVFNQSFKLCSQCHSTQYKDWVGGSHGKRLNGWAPPRTINTCVNCHNPHQPAFESRWPSRLNTVSKSKTNPE
ncbi:MAG TPA: cytochrome c3 family protein [Chryseolinea sp.]|nr:cytochrome c3 family protein [Chryseolinea sp.]